MTASSRNDDPAVRGVEKLNETASVGESETTPLILGFSVWLVTAAAALVVLVLCVLAYYLA